MLPLLSSSENVIVYDPPRQAASIFWLNNLLFTMTFSVSPVKSIISCSSFSAGVQGDPIPLIPFK